MWTTFVPFAYSGNTRENSLKEDNMKNLTYMHNFSCRQKKNIFGEKNRSSAVWPKGKHLDYIRNKLASSEILIDNDTVYHIHFNVVFV